MRLHIDTKGYTQKPKDSIAIIKNRLQKDTPPTEATLTEIIAKIEQGYSISPAVMVGGASAVNWQEQQAFFIDIDNDKADSPLLPVDEALAICKANNILPAFYYYSFSHTEAKPKYRLCFICNEVVCNINTRAVIMDTLISLFPQADTTCSNADRVFFGTNIKAVICGLEIDFTLDDVLNAYTPQTLKETPHSTKKDFSAYPADIDLLKRDFDLLGYMRGRNGATVKDNAKYVMFKTCELCGHNEDLVYYYSTNTFMCFGSGCNRGGSIIDYLMLSEHLDIKGAISMLYDLCGIKQREYIKTEKRDFAINKNTTSDNDLLQTLKELQPHQRYTHNDKGCGELFADVFKDLCRFNVTAKEWYFYNGKVWIEDTGGMQASRLAKNLTDNLLIYATTIKDEQVKQNYIEFLSKLGRLLNRKTMIEDSKDKYFISNSMLDNNHYLFNCQNGTLDLKTFEFSPHKADDLLSKISNVEYEENAKSPVFEKFLDDVMQGSTEKINYIQKLLGYSLTGDTSLETCFMLYGATTRNGKSTLVETYSYMLGNTDGYALNMKPETLAQRQNSDSRQASGDIARLDGCRFLNVSEPPKKMIFDVGLLKVLLGRDSITARHLHEREFEFIPIFKLFINTNFLPLITDDTLFTSGRINVITFDRHFQPSEQDRTLKNKLQSKENVSGLFNWCIDGLKLYYKEGAEPPQAVTNSTDEYRSDSDKVGNFISECLEKSDRNTKAIDVYNAYQKWCSSNGYGCENKSNFFAELKGKNIFYKNGKVGGENYKNVIKGYELIAVYLFDDSPPFESKKRHSYY